MFEIKKTDKCELLISFSLKTEGKYLSYWTLGNEREQERQNMNLDIMLTVSWLRVSLVFDQQCLHSSVNPWMFCFLHEAWSGMLSVHSRRKADESSNAVYQQKSAVTYMVFFPLSIKHIFQIDLFYRITSGNAHNIFLSNDAWLHPSASQHQIFFFLTKICTLVKMHSHEVVNGTKRNDSLV